MLSWRNWQTRTVESRVVEGSNPSGSTNGDEREMESGLIFNQLICEFESRRPCQIYLGRSSIGRAPHCDCGR